MKKILFFKKSATECLGVPADRLLGANRVGDSTLTFYFDDVQNKAATHCKAVITMSNEADGFVREYLQDLVKEISVGKSPVIPIYDKVNDTGFRNIGSVFSDVSLTLTNG